MGEIGHSIAEAIRKRSTSAALGTYGFFWAALHWQGIYTTLFTSEDLIYKKYGLLKNEYVHQRFFGYGGGFDFSFLWGFIAPLLLTVIFIWVVPRWMLIYAYEQEQRHKTAKRMIKLEEEQKVVTFEKKLTKEKSAALDAEIELTEKAKEAAKLDPKLVWAQEFEKFKEDPAFESFGFIIDSIYDRGGQIRVTNFENKLLFEVPGGALAIAHSNNLININNKDRTIELTDKGKYFVSRYPLGR